MVVAFDDNHHCQVLGKHTANFQQFYPSRGWVEHDLDEIWSTVQKASEGAIEQAKKSDKNFDTSKLAAIGITNQRETLCVFDGSTGKPLRRGIVWQCKRSQDICARLSHQGLGPLVREKTGLLLDPYFTGSKISWLMENEPKIATTLASGQAVLGTIDTYLMSRLSGGQAHVTEASNASRTLLYNIHQGSWDTELLEIFKVPNQDCLPKIQDSASQFCKTKDLGFLPDGIPITGVLGDQQAALAGQACFEKGEAKCTYGTGAFLLANMGDQPIPSSASLLTTVAWSLGGKLTYAFEGSSFIAGAAVQFARDNLEFLSDAKDSEVLAAKELASPYLYFVPALVGLGAPWWNPNAQGAFLGLTRSTSKGQMIRAVLEGLAFQVCDLKTAIETDLKCPLKVLRVDGGASANNLLMQVQSDFAQVSVDRPELIETTAFGAALFAGLGAGILSDLDDLAFLRKTNRIFEPTGQIQEDLRLRDQLNGWKVAVEAVEVFSKHRPN
jgi:glycerol kinase